MEIDRGISGTEDFPLLEMLVMVAIILIIAAIAVPNVIRAWQAANESSSVFKIPPVNIANANRSLFSGVNSGRLCELADDGVLDSRFSSGELNPLSILQYAAGYGPVSVHY